MSRPRGCVHFDAFAALYYERTKYITHKTPHNTVSLCHNYLMQRLAALGYEKRRVPLCVVDCYAQCLRNVKNAAAASLPGSVSKDDPDFKIAAKRQRDA